jgi:hypothetical protein
MIHWLGGLSFSGRIGLVILSYFVLTLRDDVGGF